MGFSRALLYMAAACIPFYAANSCSNTALEGPYALYLSGTSTIAGSPKPFASLSRIAFDAGGHINGYSSVNFDGLLLSNPVTGTYDVKPDCAATLSLQDDSGAWQHFSGKIANGATMNVRQTDPGAGGQGALVRTTDACTAASLRPSYVLSLSASASPLASADVPRALSVEGTVHVDGPARFTLAQRINGRDISTEGAWSVESDCTVHFELALPAGGGQPVSMKLRGAVVNQGLQIFAIHTEPSMVALARLTAN